MMERKKIGVEPEIGKEGARKELFDKLLKSDI